MNDNIPPIVKELADAVSTAVEVQNRYWLALAGAGVFVLVPQIQGEANGSVPTIPLPFGLPNVDQSWFALLAIFLLSALSIAFAAAQTHVIRTQRLAHRILTKRCESQHLIAGEDERDIFDALRKSSLSHVSSLAQALGGRFEFFSDLNECPLWRRRLSIIVYAVLKFLVILVWLILPCAVLILAVNHYLDAPTPPIASFMWPWLVWPIVIAAVFSLFITIWLEIKYLFGVVQKIWRT